MKQGIYYDHYNTPAVSWSSIRMLLIMTSAQSWYTKQLDYVIAFPQAPVERELYTKTPKGVDLEGKLSYDHVLNIHRNIYGQKNADENITSQVISDIEENLES